MAKRNVDLVVLSDVHLGTYGCHAKELLKYLKSISPKTIILNGDIIDIWQFSKRYWPESHMLVVRKIMKFVGENVPVYYLTGNHDEMLRKFADTQVGSFHLANKLVLNLNGKKAWFFHGDVFDITMQRSKWIAKLGAIGYDSLILLNSFVNWCLVFSGREKMSFSKKIKSKFKDAIKFINDFEHTAAELAVENGYSYVVCGHIHQPIIKSIHAEKGEVLYLNSGDWVENLTSLEYHGDKWSLYHYESKHYDDKAAEKEVDVDLREMLNINSLLTSISAK